MSVSTFMIGMGAATPVSLTIFPFSEGLRAGVASRSASNRSRPLRKAWARAGAPMVGGDTPHIIGSRLRARRRSRRRPPPFIRDWQNLDNIQECAFGIDRYPAVQALKVARRRHAKSTDIRLDPTRRHDRAGRPRHQPVLGAARLGRHSRSRDRRRLSPRSSPLRRQRRNLAAAVTTILLIVLIVVPVSLLLVDLAGELVGALSRDLSTKYADAPIVLPEAIERVPVIGLR